MRKAIEYDFQDDLTTLISSYDATKINLGTLMKRNTGIAPEDNWVGPHQIVFGRPAEVPLGFATMQPNVIARSDDIDEIYLCDNAAAATNRRYQYWTYTKSTNTLVYQGLITMTAFTGTAATIRGFRMIKYTYTTGTVTCGGTTTVAGSGTAWQTAGFAPGRIGFGTTDPSAVSTWYNISVIDDDTTLTLSIAGPTETDVPFIIEEYRIVIAVTTATTLTNGGLFVCKGVHPDLFTAAGTNIPIATTTDNLRATYWLADAATVTNTIAMGVDCDAMTSYSQHDCYILNANSATTVSCYKYNIRAALTDLVAGKSTLAFVLKTGTYVTTGTIPQVGNGILCTPGHGPSSGIKAIYFTTYTRVYRSHVSDIIAASTTWVQGSTMTEVPSGGIATFAATAGMYLLSYDSYSDYFYISSTNLRDYITKYKVDGSQFDFIIGMDIKQQDQVTADWDRITPVPSLNAAPFGVWGNNGLSYMLRQSTTTAIHQLYVIPLMAHWTFANITQQRIIAPKIDTTDALKYSKIYCSTAAYLGNQELGIPTEPCRIYYRTSNINIDATTGWNLIGQTGDLSAVSTASELQFMFEFKTLGQSLIPGRLFSYTLVYEDNSTDMHYEPSVSKSDKATNKFAWRQKIAFGTDIPNMRIRIYNIVTGGLVLDDTTDASGFGSWEYSPDNGATWYAWDDTQDIVGYYIRYTATSLTPASMTVRVLLTQN